MIPENTHEAAAQTFAGMRILLIEDEYFIADDFRRILEAAGAKIVGPVATLAEAHEVLNLGAFDCAVLDLNLNGESAVPIADRLKAEGRVFAIATGYGSPTVPERLRPAPRIEKPFDPSAILGLIARLNHIRQCDSGVSPVGGAQPPIAG